MQGWPNRAFVNQSLSHPLSFSSASSLTSVVWNAAYQHHPRERKQASMDLLKSFQIINMLL